MGRIPQRSHSHGIGKEIAGKVYVHRRYERILGEPVNKAKNQVPDDFVYDVVKFDQRTGTVSFIEAADFDTADEPTVGETITVRVDGTITRRGRLADPQVYHHKWLFVADDYDGFDVEASKDRSRQWIVLEGIDSSRIGYRSYWEEHVLPRLEPESS